MPMKAVESWGQKPGVARVEASPLPLLQSASRCKGFDLTEVSWAGAWGMNVEEGRTWCQGVVE